MMYYGLGMGRGIMAGEEKAGPLSHSWQRMGVKQRVIMKKIQIKSCFA
jgi:hypothetical protein